MKKYKTPSSYRRQFQDLLPHLFPELAGTKIIAKNITFVVTEKCNLNCSYCYQCSKNFQKVMNKETAKKAVDMILDNNMMIDYISSEETPFVILEFIGGEPLLEVELMDYIVDYFRYKAAELNHPWMNQYMISFTSNGMLFNTESVQKFLKKNKDRVSISITIDGDKELHDSCRVQHNGEGSYDIVVESIKTAIKEYGTKQTKVTLAPENIQYLSKAIKHLFELGLKDINANCVFENVWIPERDTTILYKELIKLADYIIDNKIYEYGYCSLFDDTIGQPMSSEDDNNWCGGNGQMLAIGTDGRCFPCIRFMKYSLANKDREEFEIGDVNRGIDLEKDNKHLKCLSCLSRKSQSTDECFNCSVASGCAWCTGYNYDYFGDPNKRATFICWTHKARVLANYYYWNKIYSLTDTDLEFKLNLTEEEVKLIKGEVQWK